MARIALYTQPGETSIFLGEVELGEQEFTQPVDIYAANVSIYTLSDVTVKAEGAGAQYVQFSSNGDDWSTVVEIGTISAKETALFQTRIKTPPIDAGPESFTFELVTTSIEVVS